MATKPHFVFVHGAWHHASVWDELRKMMLAKGYESSAVTLVSVNSSPRAPDHLVDAEVVRKAVSEVVDTGSDVVLVMHSYGGVAGSEAMKYFMPGSEDNGKGKVVRLVYMTAFVLPVGASLMSALGGKPLDWFIVNGDILRCKNSKEIFYNDLSDEKAEKLEKELGTHSYNTLKSALTAEPYTVIPSAYFFCEKDNAIPIQAQEGMVAAAKEKAPKSFDLAEKFDCSHSPMVSIPDKCAEFLVKAAGGA